MRIAAEEFAARRAALAARLAERGLTGACSSTRTTSTYYTGFAFIPTERPIAFALAADGRGGMLVPRLEVEHAQANAAVSEVAHYDEYPGERHPMEALRELLDALGVRDRARRRQRRLPVDVRLPRPVARRATAFRRRTIADLVEDQMAIKSAGGDRAAARELQWANLAHTLLQRYTRPGVTETEVETRASTRGDVRDARRDRPALPRRRARGSTARSPATAARSGATRRSRTRCRTTSSSRPATCSSPARRRRCGATTRSSSGRW